MNMTLRSKLRSKLPIQSAVDAQRAALPQPTPHREQLAVLLIGSAEGVRENIHELHSVAMLKLETGVGYYLPLIRVK